jgi:cytochrome c-type protein NapB
MNRIIAAALAYVALGLVALASAEAQEVKTLRGEAGLVETTRAPELYDPSAGKRFERAFRQQPPLIPHKVDKYEIDIKVNQCMRCHDWPQNVRENAPKISETHYVNREGTALDRLSRNRWFCLQCHVVQTDALPLVENKFQPVAIPR